MNEIPILLGDLKRIKAREAGGVVHQPVKPAEPVLDVAEQPGDLGDALEVRPEQFRAAAVFRGASGIIL